MRKNTKILIIVLAILVTIIVLALVDYNKVKSDNKPIFCFAQNKLDDGGTIEYIGLGYKIIAFHKIEGISSYYGGVHAVPLFIQTNQVYKNARGNDFASLGKDNKELYNILAKLYDRNELNKLFSEIRKYNKRIEKEYKIVKIEKGIQHISYKHGYNLVPPSVSEVELYKLSMEAYNSGILDISDKAFLYNRIEKFYKENKSNLENENKSLFEIFFYGMDYTKITY